MNRIYNQNNLDFMLHEEMKEYEAARRLKPDERKSLLDWVAEGNSVYNNPFYVYDDYGTVDYISAYRHCMKEHKRALRKELKAYEYAIANLKVEERDALREWVLGGNSVYDNPYHMTDDYGKPLDFVDAVRTAAELMEYEEHYCSA